MIYQNRYIFGFHPCLESWYTPQHNRGVGYILIDFWNHYLEGDQTFISSVRFEIFDKRKRATLVSLIVLQSQGGLEIERILERLLMCQRYNLRMHSLSFIAST